MFNFLWYILTIPLRIILTVLFTFFVTALGTFFFFEELNKKGKPMWKEVYETYNCIWCY